MYSDLDSCVIIQRGLERDPVLGDDGDSCHPATVLQHKMFLSAGRND